MINHLFGNYLVDSGCITSTQLEQVFETQKKVRVKLGLIAVSEKLMTTEQADEVNALQQIMDKRFGDIAVEKGYLTDEQVGRLLSLQGNAYLSFAQAITDNGFMELTAFEKAFGEYQKALEFTATDMDALKSGESDRIVPLFLPEGCDRMQVEHILIAIRSILRLLDSDAYIDKASFVSKLEVDNASAQSLKGEKEATLCLAGDGNSLLAVAEPFAKDTFEKVDLDALDAVAEFINCVNGMYASKIAQSMGMDMLPPEYREKIGEIAEENMVVLPVFIKGCEIKLVSKFNGTINL